MNEFKLKPCPFCGKTAKIKELSNSFQVCCEYCLADAGFYDTKESAVKFWNTRNGETALAENILREIKEMKSKMPLDLSPNNSELSRLIQFDKQELMREVVAIFEKYGVTNEYI